MTATHVIEFSVSEIMAEAENRYDALVDTIVEQFVPAVGITTGTCPDELAARLMTVSYTHLTLPTNREV